MTKAYLALDLGTTMGWAVTAPILNSGSISHASKARHEGGGMRYLRFTGWLNELIKHQAIGRIAFEEVRNHAGVTAAHVYGGFMSHLMAWADQHQIPYESVPVGTIKKHATGKGNAGKELMIKAMRKKGHNPVDDNEADALAILYWMIDVYGTPYAAYERPAPDGQPRRRLSVETVRFPRRPVSS